MRALRIGNFFQRFAQKMKRIGNSGEQARRGERFLNDFAAAVAQNEQIGGEVSAVNAGDILGIERNQVARVVPIVKMAAVQLELTHGMQRGFQPVCRFLCAQPTHVARRESREQIQSNIGGRSSMGHDGLGIFLKIIRRQETVFGGDKFLEKPPGAPRQWIRRRLGVGCRQSARRLRPEVEC